MKRWVIGKLIVVSPAASRQDALSVLPILLPFSPSRVVGVAGVLLEMELLREQTLEELALPSSVLEPESDDRSDRL